MRKNSAFFGSSGGGLTVPNNVDISQRTAGGLNDAGFVAEAMRAIRNNPKIANHPVLQSEVLSKRLEDLLRDSDSGHDSTAVEDARLEQGRPENGQPFPTDAKIMPATHGEDIDEYAAQAEHMIRNLERSGALNMHATPQERYGGMTREAYVQDLAEKLRGKPAMAARPQEPKEEPILTRSAHDNFFGNVEEMKKYTSRKF